MIERVSIPTGQGLSRRRLLKLGAGATAAGALAGISPRRAEAVLKLDLVHVPNQPLPIALPQFIAASRQDMETARGIVEIIASDLQGCGRFALIDPATFIQKEFVLDALPRFEDWRRIKAQLLVIGRVSRFGDGRLVTAFRLWDVFGSRQLHGAMHSATPAEWQRVAHIVSDAIYEQITGEKGAFVSSTRETTEP